MPKTKMELKAAMDKKLKNMNKKELQAEYLKMNDNGNDDEDDEKGPQLLVGFGDIEERGRANTLIKRLKEQLERGDHAAAVRAFVRTLPDAASVSGAISCWYSPAKMPPEIGSSRSRTGVPVGAGSAAALLTAKRTNWLRTLR